MGEFQRLEVHLFQSKKVEEGAEEGCGETVNTNAHTLIRKTAMNG
jgi:hypothetical protein